jgi:hypothetical protein
MFSGKNIATSKGFDVYAPTIGLTSQPSLRFHVKKAKFPSKVQVLTFTQLHISHPKTHPNSLQRNFLQGTRRLPGTSSIFIVVAPAEVHNMIGVCFRE